MQKQHNFPNEYRLKNSADFLKVFSARQIRMQQAGFTIWAHEGPANAAKLGIALSKKKLPKAVQRNHIRRLVRESFRVNKSVLMGYEVIVQVHRWDVVATHEKFFQRLSACWSQLQVEKASRVASA